MAVLIRFVVVLAVLWVGEVARAQAPGAPGDPQVAFSTQTLPLIQKYCLGCHSAEKRKGGLDLERFNSITTVRKDVKPWQLMIEQLEAEEMPPSGKPQPTADERARLLAWVHGFLDAEARARAGDPGHLPLRRLSNAEYDYTIRDLTGVDLRPAKEFPADGAGGEGFTNAAESLADMSPTLLNKYLLAAKEIAAHAVLLPDGFRFSPNKTRRDWSDEGLAQLRTFYGQFTSDGRVNFQPYLAATIRHRELFAANAAAIDAMAKKEKLSAKYLRILFQTLTDKQPSFPLDAIRAHWRGASEKEAGALAAEIAGWQAQLWKTVPIGSYRDGNLSRQKRDDSAVGASQTVRLGVKPAAGQNDVVLYLATREILPADKAGGVIWSRPRLEGAKQPTLLLSDYPKYGLAYEIDYPAAFADSADYLAGVIAARDGGQSVEEIAKKAKLDAARLKRWVELAALAPRQGGGEGEVVLKTIAATPVELLGEKTPKNADRPAINGWRGKGNDLPVVMSNSSDTEEHIPGRASAHRVIVHPMPAEFVAVVWKSPIEGVVRVSANVSHAHPSCGNGVAYWLEHRQGDRAGVLAEGGVELGKSASVPAKSIKVARGEQIVLAIDAKNREHTCDLTEIGLTIVSADGGQKWDLSADVADDIQAGNPHADRLGNEGVWSFVKGPSRPISLGGVAAVVPADSALGKWREAAVDPARAVEAAKLAREVQELLTGPRPGKEKDPNRVLFEALLSPESPLLQGVDLSKMPKRKETAARYGLEAGRLGVDGAGNGIDAASFGAGADSVTEIRLPAGLLRDREFVVDGKLDSGSNGRAAQFAILTSAPGDRGGALGANPIVAPDNGPRQDVVRGSEDFRSCFPLFTCFPGVIPVDEVVCLKMYHREDEPLIRLFLDDAQRREIERIWEQHRFITQQPVAENKYLPLFIGFVTQDQSKELLAYYEGQREPFRKRAEEFEREVEAAVPGQLEKLMEFASRAYRRPLLEKEKAEFTSLYQTLRGKGMNSDDAFRGVLARIFVAPSFLFKIEQPPAGKEAGPVNDFELATRLSYFLWSSIPDDELRALAASGRLHEPDILAQQTRRMLKDDRIRALGIEFGTQWIHVRGFDGFKEKSESRFPAFDDKLRAAMYEETILFFQDLFQQDEPIERLLSADYTYLNDTLAKHYGVPNVAGPQWRRVDGVRKFGRGGILALGSVQSKQAGAARTSPVLRGNWVMETLLGEKLPKPPPDVPRLPEEEGGDGALTMRQMVEKHTSVQSCAVCHQRIDPLGFAFERYDAIGRLRDKESTGLPIDCRSKLKDVAQFEGLDGLRDYLLTKRQDVIIRLFCRRLLGYALGRAVMLSDQTLLDEMVGELKKNDGHLSAAVLSMTRSAQFRKIRGSAFSDE